MKGKLPINKYYTRTPTHLRSCAWNRVKGLGLNTVARAQTNPKIFVRDERGSSVT